MQKEERFHKSKLHRHTGQILEKPKVSRITRSSRMGRSKLCSTRYIGSRRSLVSAHEVRISGSFIKWIIQLKSSGHNGRMATRPDNRAAVQLKHRLHHESGEFKKSQSIQKNNIGHARRVSLQLHIQQVLASIRRQDGNYDRFSFSSSSTWWQSHQWKWSEQQFKLCHIKL